jgi:hypothetical protein
VLVPRRNDEDAGNGRQIDVKSRNGPCSVLCIGKRHAKILILNKYANVTIVEWKDNDLENREPMGYFCRDGEAS